MIALPIETSGSQMDREVNNGLGIRSPSAGGSRWERGGGRGARAPLQRTWGRRARREQALLLVPLRGAGHGIVPAGGPGVAAQQAPSGQPGAANRTVHLDSPQ